MPITSHTVESLRNFENEVARLFNAGKIRAPVHLSSGNEEALIKIFQEVREDDWVCCSWRSHLHCLLKGVPEAELMDAILAGRSITLCFPKYRIISSAIVGGILPIATGIAMGIWHNCRQRWKLAGWAEDSTEVKQDLLDWPHSMVWAFLGDMTAASGIAHECYEFSWRQSLPVIFIVENNDISVCTPTSEAWGTSSVPPSIRGDEAYSYKNPWPHSGAGTRVEF